MATELRVERAAWAVSAPGPFTVLPGPAFGSTSFVDAEHGDGTAYGYRVRYGTGGTWSHPAEGWSERIDVVAPDF